MSTVINTNLASLFAQNSLTNAQNNLATSVQRLSSGLRINSAKDDAAGLAISQNMQSQINGTNQSIQNLSNATNLLQTADSSLSTIQDMLLRLKQLSTQGFDGSLNATQKQDIVQQMSDLNTEINQTASRTAFNGISLLGSAATIDNVNSGVYAGQYLTETAAAFNNTGSITAASGALAADYNGTINANVSASTYSIILSNDDLVRQNPGTYSITSVGNQLTLQTTSNGVPLSQTLTVNDANGDTGATKENLQTLNFDKLGVTLNIDNTVSAGVSQVLGADIAAQYNGGTFKIDGNAAKITSIDTNGTAPGTYTFTNTGAVLKLAWTDSSSVDHSDSVDLTNLSFKAGTDTQIAFGSAGITLNLHNFNTVATKSDIATEIVALQGKSNAGTTGTISVVNNGDSALNFQSGATSASYITINTANMFTGTGGTYNGNSLAMQGLGSVIAGSTGLTKLNSGTSSADWQAAFKNAAAAVDTAIDYVSTQRSTYGSQMNRLSYISQNLTAQSTNLQQSRSAIVDTNFASETATLTKGQIMQQAATAMLAQANQMPNVILSLLK
jgi:flagellin